MRVSRATSVAVVGLSVIAITAGCSSGQSNNTKSSSAPKSTASVTAPATAGSATITQYPLPTGTISNNTTANGPRTQVAITSCAAVDGGWGASGTAKNPGTSAVTYDITIFFTSTGATVLDYATASVKVAAGKTENWTAAAKFAAPSNVLCVLRGVA